MDNQIFLYIGIVILINLLDQIFLFWIKRVHPNLKNFYFIAKSDVAALYDTPTIWNRITAAMQVCYYTLKSLVPFLHRQIYISIRSRILLFRSFLTIIKHLRIKSNSEI